MLFILVSVFQTETKMGTYTTNYQLFMPSIGEQGWGDLVNENFTTIDVTMKGLDTRLTTCESTDMAYNTRLETLEAGEFETVTANTGNFAQIILPTLTYNGYFTISASMWLASGSYSDACCVPLFSGFIPVSGVVSAKYSGTNSNSANGASTAKLYIIETSGARIVDLTTTQTEYSVTNAVSVFGVSTIDRASSASLNFTFGIPTFV